MPELPEVETIRRQLSPLVTGRTVLEVTTHPSEKFVAATETLGATFGQLRRRGKFLLFELDDDREMIVHLGMTGQLLPHPDPDTTHVRARWRLDGDTDLVFRDIRRFGRIRIASSGRYEGTLAVLGPEPFSSEFTPAGLYATLRSSNRRLKTQLLSQRPVAGVGNIYADEACFAARVHPGSRRVTRQQAAALHRSIVDVLAQGVANGGTTLRDYVDAAGQAGQNQHDLRCYGRGGQPCEDCGHELRRVVLDGRSTTFCPTCQPRR